MTSTSRIGRAGELTGPAAVVRTRGAPSSSTVPQAWHSPHRPTHLPVAQPHSVQRNDGRGAALAVAAPERRTEFELMAEP